MAVPVHLILKDDGGAVIRGGSDVQYREGSVELRGLRRLERTPNGIKKECVALPSYNPVNNSV